MKKILIVEDEQDVRLNLQDLLEAESYHVVTANDGLAGYNIAIEEEPDLVISDIKMANMDGYSLYKRLKNNSATSTIPFIFLTAKVEMSDLRTGMNLGADDYLTKPFKIEDVLTVVETRLRKKESFVKELEQLRESLLRRVPHELRTPLVGIIGFSQLIEDDFDNLTQVEVRDMINKIKKSGRRLHRRIEKFLCYAELISKGANEPVNNNGNESLFELDTRLIEHRITAVIEDFDRKEDVSIKFAKAHIKVSERYYEMIIRELVENALKFSSRGSKVVVTGEKRKNSYITKVEDFGCGIADASIKEIKVLKQFADEKYLKEGVGMGLALVQKIVKACGGYLKIESELNKSTTVEFGLPFAEL